MGQTRMGKYEFSSWTLHMASIIIFSTLWGIVLREWKGTSKRTHVLIAHRPGDADPVDDHRRATGTS